MTLPAPDSPEANSKGCVCPPEFNGKGTGTRTELDGGWYVREWIVNPRCQVHGDPKAWSATVSFWPQW